MHTFIRAATVFILAGFATLRADPIKLQPPLLRSGNYQHFVTVLELDDTAHTARVRWDNGATETVRQSTLPRDVLQAARAPGSDATKAAQAKAADSELAAARAHLDRAAARLLADPRPLTVIKGTVLTRISDTELLIRCEEPSDTALSTGVPYATDIVHLKGHPATREKFDKDPVRCLGIQSGEYQYKNLITGRHVVRSYTFTPYPEATPTAASTPAPAK